MATTKIAPIHPGEILLEEFLEPLSISQYKLAKDIHVPLTRIHAIIQQRRAITADTALRLSVYFNTSKDFWLGLQKRFELDCAEDQYAKEIASIVPLHLQAA